jgi:hypothetical protein
MSELRARAAELRAANAAAHNTGNEALEKQRALSRRRVGEFIGLLRGAGVPAVPLYAETYRKGDPRLGDQLGGRTLSYQDVLTGFMRLGEGWVVREYDHNEGDILDGVFVLSDGSYTRSLTKVDYNPSGNLKNVPERPFYRIGWRIMPDEMPNPLEAAGDIIQQGTDFAHDENMDLLAQALTRYGVA